MPKKHYIINGRPLTYIIFVVQFVLCTFCCICVYFLFSYLLNLKWLGVLETSMYVTFGVPALPLEIKALFHTYIHTYIYDKILIHDGLWTSILSPWQR